MLTESMADNLMINQQQPPVGSPAGSSGALKATITLGHGGRQPSFRGYFYLLRDGSIDSSTSGAADWLALAGLRDKHDQYKAKPPAEELSEFVDGIAGCLDSPASEDHGSLLSLLEKPPVVREIVPFTTNALNAFRLLPGPIPARFKHLVYIPPKRPAKPSNEQQRPTNYPPNYEAGRSSYLLPPPSSSLLDDARGGIDFAPSSQESAPDFMSPSAMDDDADYQIPAEKKRRKSEKRRKGK